MNCKSFRYLLVCFMLMLIAVQESKSEEIFNNSDACVEWKFSDPQTINETVITPAKAFSVATIEHNATTVGSGSRSKDPDSGLKFVTFTGENVQLHWFVKPSKGLTFTPTQIRMYVQRFGTNKKDGVVVTTQVEGGETTTLGTYTARRANWDDSQEEGQWKEALPNLVNEIVIDLTADHRETDCISMLQRGLLPKNRAVLPTSASTEKWMGQWPMLQNTRWPHRQRLPRAAQ